MITKNIKERIRVYFFENPTTKLRLRQIERILKLPFPSVVRYVKELGKEEILKSEAIGNIKLYSSDRSSKIFLLEKKLYNIKTIYDSGMVEYLIQEHSNPTIVLFGSYSKGEDIEKSDIDIYIEMPKEEKINMEKFEKKLNKRIQIFLYKNIKNVENKELANNIINGITLNGFIEVY